MNKQQLLAAAQRIVDERRFSAEDRAEKAKEELRRNDEWRALESALRSAQVELAMGNGTAEQVNELEAQCRKLLEKLGVDEQTLLPRYSCSLCNDTGYVNGKRCSCLEEELRKLILAQSNVINDEFTFENSTETNKHNRAVAKQLRKVLSDGTQNALLSGRVGTGKTYLLTACANLAAREGRSVLFVTAYSLNADFLRAYLVGQGDVEALLNALTDVDVLLIDDLGTEKLINNVTANYLFNVLNERTVNKKQTFITSNLTLTDLHNRYDERIFSRLLDQKHTFVALLEGKDKRMKDSPLAGEATKQR